MSQFKLTTFVKVIMTKSDQSNFTQSRIAAAHRNIHSYSPGGSGLNVHLHLIRDSSGPHESAAKRHHDRFCGAQRCAQHIYKHTDHGTCDMCGNRSHTYALRRNELNSEHVNSVTGLSLARPVLCTRRSRRRAYVLPLFHIYF